MERGYLLSFFNWAKIKTEFTWLEEKVKAKFKTNGSAKVALLSLAVTFPMFFYSTLLPQVDPALFHLKEPKAAIRKPVAAAPVQTAPRQDLPGWVWPVQGRLYTYWSGYHHGLDIINRSGSRVAAAHKGTVVKINTYGWGGGYGKYVVIRHRRGLYSIYAHLSRVEVRPGQVVFAGEEIGRMGTTGRSSGVHLHFGIGPSLMVNSGTYNPLSFLP